MSLKYRPEIDGLRAIAVTVVIFFHAGFSLFSGGFIGVDVFFVLSGYLISSIILKEREAGTFSLIHFYERRARRILPALFLVMLLCLPFAWALLLPKAMEEFSKSLIAVSTFLSNVLFWRESGYFSSQADLKPLLHTWTLSVEEQFYFFLPLFIIITGKLKSAIVYGALALIMLGSLTLAHIGNSISPTATFYLLPTRAWELFIGVCVGYYLSSRKSQPKGNNLVSFAGLAMIIVAALIYDKTTPFPSFYALLPTVGTALIVLFTDKTTLLYKVLSLKVMVGLGLISYSLYLWHQPVFAFAKHASLHDISLTKSLCLILFSVLGAYISWRFVERPFRDKSKTTGKQIFWFSLIGSAAFIAIGLFGVAKDGDLERFNQEVKTIAATSPGSLKRCKAAFNKSGCFLGLSGAQPSIVIIGDSHSGALQKALNAELSTQNKSALSFAGSWCVPLLGVRTKAQYRNKCSKGTSADMKAIISNPQIHKVILVAEWANYTQGYRWGVEKTALYEDDKTIQLSLEENSEVFSRGVSRTIELLKKANKEVVFVKSVPEYSQHVPAYLAKSLILTGQTDMHEYTIDKEKYYTRNAEVEKVLNDLNVSTKISVVDTYSVLCPNDKCKYISDNGEALYSDDNHLSEAGARLIVGKIFDGKL